MGRRIIAIVGVALLAGCAAKMSEYPLEDGDWFEYAAIESPSKQYGIESAMIYRVVRQGEGGFLLKQVSMTRGPGGEQAIDLPDRDTTYDRYGRMVAGGGKNGPGRNQGRFSRLWLPPEKRVEGASVRMENFFKQEAVVSGPVEWQGWNAWVAAVANYTCYYEHDSGLLVGWTDSVRPIKLTASNRGLL